MDTSFQLGLELTNILTPLTSAVSALGSLALVKAIKNAGSDALTEIELASFLGRNRIAPGMELHFRQIVGRSETENLSHYMDIVLDSGAGPTVQNALRNPELLSMVIQLSALCFVHESGTLAQAIVEAIERNLKEIRADLGKVPDYLSLCGTLRVCKQETASFQWSAFYDAVEKKIESSLNDTRPRKRRKRSAGSHKTFRPISLDHSSIADRTLPFPVLQILLLSLHSLQHFAEERLLNIECISGISTAIIWCYYILGLNVKLIFQGCEITFGEPSANVFIRESTLITSCASLMHPNSRHEPLFNLISSEGDPRIGPELRKKARGFGQEVIKQLGVGRRYLKDYPNWVMHQSLRVMQARAGLNGLTIPENSHSNQLHCFGKWSNAELYNFTEENIIRTGEFLFDKGADKTSDEAGAVSWTPPKKHLLDLSSLVVLLLSLARVQPEDLQNCSDLPLSTQVQQQLKDDEPCVQFISQGNLQAVALGLTASFDILSRFLQGPTFSKEANKRTFLVSACGWSLYFDSINSLDPAEAFASTLRIVLGVPARHDIRKTRILDGPTQLFFSPSTPVLLQNQWGRSVDIFPGVSLANRGQALIAHHESDAFQITQPFEWQYRGNTPRKHLLGFREMLELCLRFSRLLPCHCDRDALGLYDVAKIYFTHEDLHDDEPLNQETEVLRNFYCLEGEKIHNFSDRKSPTLHPAKTKPLNECVFSAQNGSENEPASEVWLFYVSHNPAARWMEMCDLYPRIVENCDQDSRLILRSPETCLQCAFEAVVPKYEKPSTKGFQGDNIPVTYVLL